MDRYKYLIIDAQYYLVRTSYMLLSTKGKQEVVTYKDGTPYLKEGKEVKITFPNYAYTDIMQNLFYSVAKLAREYPARKVILLFDKSPYWRTLMVKEYKSSRVYYSDEDLELLDQDEDPVKYFSMKANVEFNNIKNHAKASVCKYFPKFGMPVFVLPHYEADDLAYIAAMNCKNLNERSALCTIDSDWKFRLNGNVDMITPKGKIITYGEVQKSVPEGWDIYEYHKYHDSFGFGHNDLNNLLTDVGKKMSVYELRKSFELGNYTNFTNPELVKVQLSTFDIDKFEDYDQAFKLMSDSNMEKEGEYVADLELFKKSMFFKIGWKYYSNFLSTLDLSLYKKLSL